MNIHLNVVDLFTYLKWIFGSLGALLGLAVGLQAANTLTEILPGVLSGRWEKKDLWRDFSHRMIGWTGYYRR
jgi:hypothetical protein